MRGLVVVALFLALGGCAKEEAAPAPGKIEGLAPVEVERGIKACDAYVARVCACAETRSEFAETCALAKASPTALQINLDLLASSGLKVVEQKAVKVEARKIVAACFAAESKLDVATCPRNP